jgi:hypothetical protein
MKNDDPLRSKALLERSDTLVSRASLYLGLSSPEATDMMVYLEEGGGSNVTRC